MTRDLRARSLSTVRTKRLEWLYRDRIPLRTGTIIAGQGGIAKSTIISDVIARATRGQLPGTFEGQPVSIGLISPEDDLESVLVPRLLAAGADLDRIVSLSSVNVTNGEQTYTTLPNIAEDLGALGKEISDNDIRLLVVDPLVSIMVGNSISQSDVRRNFDPLSSLAAELDFAALCVAHFGKSGERAGDRLSGSHAFRDVARVLIVAAVDEETGNRVLTVEKSNYSPVQPSDAYAIDTVTVALDDGNMQEVGRARLIGRSDVTVQEILDRDREMSSYSPLTRQVVEYVNQHPAGVDAKQVAEALGEDEAKVRKYLNRAVGRDIDRAKRGTFAPLSHGSSGSSGSSSTHLGQITHRSSIETCPKCGEELHSALSATGATIHPGCEAA